MTSNRIAAAALAAVAAVGAIPLALAQLDFAGVLNAFDIHASDTPVGVLVLAGVSGFLTFGVLVLALWGVALTLTESPAARNLLVAAAVLGFATALVFWIPAGIMLGAAVLILDDAEKRERSLSTA
jgi:hypothetical protein